MQDDEAKRLRCPFHVAHNCIADACMGWRWTSWVPGYQTREGAERKGFCGMAGKISKEVIGGWGGEE